MPYTPPARSPNASGATSPAERRPHLRTESPPRSPNRPNLPRSASSAAYLQKSRRSPAYSTDSQNLRLGSERGFSEKDREQNTTTSQSLRQSPPPIVDGTQLPPGLILSPPDSTQNSSDDEETAEDKQRSEDLEQLQDEVRRTIAANPESLSSEEASPTGLRIPRLDALSAYADNAALSPSARKISHMRAATETSFFERRESMSSRATSDSDDDDSPTRKPPLLRKKSGELVKPAIRPPSRRRHSSMPGTPTYSKAVHFNDQIEQVRHFLQVDRPIAVSAGGSPVDSHDEDTEFPFQPEDKPASVSWEIRLANFPTRNSYERMSNPVRLETLVLSPDEKSLIGEVAIANLAFQKWVTARFTLDYWKTTSEVVAEYSHDPRHKGRNDGCDVFKFNIRLSDQANLETRTLLLCMRYNVNGQEHWDSNEGQNYQVDFVKTIKPSKSASFPMDTTPVAHGPSARPVPRSRHNSSNATSRGRPLRTFDDDILAQLEDGTSNIRLRNQKQSTASFPNTPPPRRTAANSQQFGVRYDFGASLSAALSHAQAQLGDRSGIKLKRAEGETSLQPRSNPTTGNVTAQANMGAESPRPEALLANRQSLDSRAYQEFVSKFCFFGSGKGATTSSSATNASNGTDGTQDATSPTSQQLNHDATQPSTQLDEPASQTNGASDVPRSLQTSGSSSPRHSLTANQTSRPSTAPSYGYPPYPESRLGLFPEAQATAIHG